VGNEKSESQRTQPSELSCGGGNTTRQGMKIHRLLAAGLLCVATLTTGACVTRSTYDSAVADLEATKVELDSTRTQSQALTEQVRELQQRKIDLARQMEAVSSELQRATQQMKAEHIALQARLSKLNRTISQLIAQQSRLRYALQRVYEEQPALESIIEKYKSKLSEADGQRASLYPPPIEGANQQAETALAPPAQVATQTDPALKPTVTTPAASTDQTATSPKPSLVNKQPSEPIEDDWLSLLKGWAISLWRSIFS
jgi:peptidoglycan hydrolase CwlO-like protein